MITADRLKRLQEVADYRTVRQTLRGGAIGSLVFGGLALLLGLVSPMDPILAGVGAVLVGTGLWNFFAPRPTGIIVDGLTLVMVGVYNLADVFIGAAQGQSGAGSGVWAKLGVFQIIWGVQSFWRFFQFREAFKTPATGAELLELDGMAKELWKARVKDSSDTIELNVSGLHAKKWKVRLEPEAALMATQGGLELRLCGRDELDIEDTGKAMLSKTRNVKLRIGAKESKGSMSPESFERFRQWKHGVSIPRAIAA
jgi:hypothetical protein